MAGQVVFTPSYDQRATARTRPPAHHGVYVVLILIFVIFAFVLVYVASKRPSATSRPPRPVVDFGTPDADETKKGWSVWMWILVVIGSVLGLALLDAAIARMRGKRSFLHLLLFSAEPVAEPEDKPAIKINIKKTMKEFMSMVPRRWRNRAKNYNTVKTNDWHDPSFSVARLVRDIQIARGEMDEVLADLAYRAMNYYELYGRHGKNATFVPVHLALATILGTHFEKEGVLPDLKQEHERRRGIIVRELEKMRAALQEFLDDKCYELLKSKEIPGLPEMYRNRAVFTLAQMDKIIAFWKRVSLADRRYESKHQLDPNEKEYARERTRLEREKRALEGKSGPN